MFDMESEEEYRKNFLHSKASHQLCQKRDSLPEFDPLRQVLQTVTRQASNLTAKELYSVIADLGLYEIELARIEHAKRDALETLKQNEVIREAMRKQNQAEVAQLKAAGFNPHYKVGERWIERAEDIGWDEQ